MIDMKIKDEELEAYASKLLSAGKGIDNRIARLRELLGNVCENGVQSGAFHDNLQLFVDLLSTAEGELRLVTLGIEEDVTHYLENIDELDGYFY